jgi:hypothetical protein
MRELISKAVELNNMELLKQLLEAQAEAEKMASKKVFYKSLSEFQSELPAIKKTKTVYNRDGKTVRYNYASFDDVVEAIKPLLNKHGLSYRFEAEYQDKTTITVRCFISHEAGHQEITEFKAIVQYSEFMLPIQSLATALTYAKRYSISLALGLATEEDTDANDLENDKEAINANIKKEIEKAKETQVKVQEKMKETKEQNEPFIDEKQVKNIQQIIERKNLKEDEALQIIAKIIGRSIISVDKIKKSEANRVMIELVKAGVE